MTFAEVLLWGTKIGTVALPDDSNIATFRKCTKADFYIILTMSYYIDNYMKEFSYSSEKDNKKTLDFSYNM